jgi:hypothetical protein
VTPYDPEGSTWNFEPIFIGSLEHYDDKMVEVVLRGSWRLCFKHLGKCKHLTILISFSERAL